jgi:branched-chain amino acid transport system permease protein
MLQAFIDGGVPMLQAVLGGILTGSVYGLFAMGFSLAFGVMRIVNFAHGALVMLGMYTGWALFTLAGIDPFLSIPVAMAAVGLLGVALYRFAYRRFAGRPTLQQFLVALALALVIQVSAQLALGPDARAVRTDWGGRYLPIGPVVLSCAQIAAGAVAAVLAAAVELTLRLTPWGRSVRAVADDPEAAEIVGVCVNRVNLGAFAFSCALAGAAGAVLVSCGPVDPAAGFTLMPIAVIAAVLGGLGSVSGAFAGGVICGVIQQLTGAICDVIQPLAGTHPSQSPLQDLPLYLLLLLFFAFRPDGLSSRRAAR